ncbi:MAG: hypothetical protein J7J54_04525 [Candidatus Omnitrophica bacterium]|nr:hypothetical protein [Candidatus Omnitrophota bacterium]
MTLRKEVSWISLSMNMSLSIKAGLIFVRGFLVGMTGSSFIFTSRIIL